MKCLVSVPVSSCSLANLRSPEAKGLLQAVHPYRGLRSCQSCGLQCSARWDPSSRQTMEVSRQRKVLVQSFEWQAYSSLNVLSNVLSWEVSIAVP
jgi:hypothetical protein